MKVLAPAEERIEELAAALRYEREVSAAARRRSELLEGALKRAYQFAVSGRRPDDDTPPA